MRVALGVEYDGTAYNGWQRQRIGTGVQEVVEQALAVVADEPIETVCAGRTDTGVHAAAQVVHFDTRAARHERAWLLGVNSNLPDDISLRWASLVDEDFHARFSAISRSYRYSILNRPVRSALNRRVAWWVHSKLDDSAMQTAADCLHGVHDFSAFRASGCGAASPIREIFDIQVRRRQDRIEITVSANAFLQHMVRNIVGTLVAVGDGSKPADWAEKVLQSKNRTLGGVAAPAHGLTLTDVAYPKHFAIPGAATTKNTSDA